MQNGLLAGLSDGPAIVSTPNGGARGGDAGSRRSKRQRTEGEIDGVPSLMGPPEAHERRNAIELPSVR